MEQQASFHSKLRQLCGRERSISEVCRRIGINRQQFNKYLAGTSLPSRRVLERICEFFGVAEADLVSSAPLPPPKSDASGDAIRLALDEARASSLSGGIARYYGCYLKYQHSTIDAGKIVRSLVLIGERHGYPSARTMVRIGKVSGAAPAKQIFRYEGIALLLKERLFIVERELLAGSEWTQSILSPSYTRVVERLYGLRLGVSASPSRDPFAARIVMERCPPDVSLKWALRQVGLFAQDDPGLPGWIAGALRHGPEDDAIMWGLPDRSTRTL